MKPRFPEDVASLVDNGHITITTGKFLSRFPETCRKPLCVLFSDLRFSVNKQREIVEWIDDILHRDNGEIAELCRALGLDEIRADARLNAPQKCNLFRERLYALRYPTLAAHLRKLRAEIRGVKLPPGVRLSVESPLEDMVFKLEIEFQTQEEFEEKLKGLVTHPLPSGLYSVKRHR